MLTGVLVDLHVILANAGRVIGQGARAQVGPLRNGCRVARKKLLTANDPLQWRVATVCRAQECVPGRQIPRASAGARAWQAVHRSPRLQRLSFPRTDRAPRKLRREADSASDFKLTTTRI